MTKFSHIRGTAQARSRSGSPCLATGDRRLIADRAVLLARESVNLMSDVHQSEIAADAAEIDAAAIVAAQTSPTAGTFDQQGRLIRSVITTKDFLSGREAFDIISGLTVPGQIAVLGSLAGEIYSAEARTKEYNGEMLTSFWLNGEFEAVVADTGEVFNAGQAILPRAYGGKVYRAFQDLGVTMIELACVIGVRRASRTIPYEWIVRDHVVHAAQSRVTANSHKLQALLGIGNAALPAPTEKKRIGKA